MRKVQGLQAEGLELLQRLQQTLTKRTAVDEDDSPNNKDLSPPVSLKDLPNFKDSSAGGGRSSGGFSGFILQPTQQEGQTKHQGAGRRGTH